MNKCQPPLALPCTHVHHLWGSKSTGQPDPKGCSRPAAKTHTTLWLALISCPALGASLHALPLSFPLRGTRYFISKPLSTLFLRYPFFPKSLTWLCLGWELKACRSRRLKVTLQTTSLKPTEGNSRFPRCFLQKHHVPRNSKLAAAPQPGRLRDPIIQSQGSEWWRRLSWGGDAVNMAESLAPSSETKRLRTTQTLCYRFSSRVFGE